MSDAECYDMIVQMGGGLTWNNQGGFWSCYACDDSNAYGDDPSAVVRECHAKWLANGGVGPVKLPDDEVERIRQRCDLDERARKIGMTVICGEDSIEFHDQHRYHNECRELLAELETP